SNFRGLENHLKQRPADLETWAFARGQALLIAESGNLLMLRPPKTTGQDAWMDRATDLREQATRLAQQAAARDLERCQLALIELDRPDRNPDLPALHALLLVAGVVHRLLHGPVDVVGRPPHGDPAGGVHDPQGLRQHLHVSRT